MAYTISNFAGKGLVEVPTIDEYNDLVEHVRTNLATNNDIINLKNYINPLIQSSQRINSLEPTLNNIIQQARESITKQSNNILMGLNKKIDDELNKSIQEINKFMEESKSELRKKFILEIDKPIEDKNKIVYDILMGLFKIINGGLRINERSPFIYLFKEIVPNSNLLRITKKRLLEVLYSDNLWIINNDLYFNETLRKALVNLSNDILSGYDCSKLLLNNDYTTKEINDGEEDMDNSNQLDRTVLSDIDTKDDAQEDLSEEYLGN